MDGGGRVDQPMTWSRPATTEAAGTPIDEPSHRRVVDWLHAIGAHPGRIRGKRRRLRAAYRKATAAWASLLARLPAPPGFAIPAVPAFAYRPLIRRYSARL